ncbi:hypothetical protein VNI00_000462 [Paramarasmius palmivorus]|uniref:Uncharacterized protein n=1 Tax=Paramarasmius palmivorus TaxID=297713 RepID=A0AAW0E6Y4_9AGAR
MFYDLLSRSTRSIPIAYTTLPVELHPYMTFTCVACNTKNLSYTGYKFHLRFSQNPGCQQLYSQLQSYVPDDSDSDYSDTGDEDDDGFNAATPFEGDYFGETYTLEDFGLSDVDVEDDEALGNGNGEGEEVQLLPQVESDDEEAVEQVLLENTWEPPRAAPSSVRYPDIDGDMDAEDVPRTAREVLEEQMRNSIFVESFPSVIAGAPIHQHRQNIDAHYQQSVNMSEENPYAPFNSKLDWEVARWAKLRGPGAVAFTELLQIEGFCERLGLSFATSNQLNDLVDSLPGGRPKFHRQELVIYGQVVEFFYRDIQDCIKALWADPDFTPFLVFVPEKHFRDATRTIRLYHDMHTGDWWWDTQVEFESQHPGATIVPIIISSDKTQVTLFRNKTAYPVYMTIGNLPKSIRRKPSRQGQILVAYLPTAKLNNIKVKASYRRVLANLFHTCMTFILAPLVELGERGMKLVSGDGAVRRGHPVYAVFVGDYPEQLLVACLKNGECPAGVIDKDQLGNPDVECVPRDTPSIIKALNTVSQGYDVFYQSCQDVGIKPVQNVFWQNLPHVDIFRSITPDVLHQLHQGVIKHVFSWLKQIFPADEIDARCRRLPPNHNLRLFPNGITHLSRITGTEHAQLSKFILGIIIDIPLPNGLSSQRLIRAVRAILDFLYLAQYPIHSTQTLESLEFAHRRFHENKSIFADLGIQKQFKIPKLHFCRHYSDLIKRFGTTDNYSTEYTERLHIDTTKEAYAATNHKDEYTQMTAWVERKENVMCHERYIQRRLAGTEGYSTFNSSASLKHPPTLIPNRRLQMAMHPSANSVPFDKLVYDYGATDFEYTLGEYVAQAQAPDRRLTAATLRSATQRVLEFVPFSKVPVFHRIKFTESDPYSVTKSEEFVADSVHVEPKRKDKRGREIPGRFDTVLVRVKHENSGIRDFRVAQVRCVFSLPKAALKEWFPSSLIQPAKYLAYVDWFTPFKTAPEANHLMYKVSHAFRSDGARAASVVAVDSIVRSVHLIPKFGPVAPQDWNSSNVLEICDTFFVNDFLDRSSYASMY